MLDLADKVCINEVSSNFVFIKSYNQPYERRVEYQYESFRNRRFYSAEQICADIAMFADEGKYAEWIDLSLYYSAQSESVVLVDVLFSSQKRRPKYRVSIVQTLNSLGDDKIDVNDYVKELSVKLKR